MRACVQHSQLFLPETLRWAGWHYAGRLYQCLKERYASPISPLGAADAYSESLTFNDWNNFSAAFPEETRRHEQFTVDTSGQRNSTSTLLTSIVGRMAKLNPTLVTFLCLESRGEIFEGPRITFDQLMTLVDIPTLGGLVLEGLDPHVNRYHLASWTRAACEKGTFQSLKLLVITGSSMFREHVLSAVSKLPSLCLIGFPSHHLVHQSQMYEDRQLMSSRWYVEFLKASPHSGFNIGPGKVQDLQHYHCR